MTDSNPTATLPLIIAPRLRAPRGGLTVAGRYYRGGTYLPASARPFLEAVAAKAAAVSLAQSVVVGITGFSYEITSLPIDASIGSDAFLVSPLHKPREAYHVHRSTDGEVQCSCPDFVWRKAGTGVMCRHGYRLAELGLIHSTTPKVLPPFALRSTVAEVALPTPWIAPTPSVFGGFHPTAAEEAEAVALRIGGGR